jgi:hypothetical protein
MWGQRAPPPPRLHGIRHDGEWFHVGTPQALDLTRDWFSTGRRLGRHME